MSKTAIISTGGKQFFVKEGSVVKSEKIDGKIGDIVKFASLFKQDQQQISFSTNDQDISAEILEQKKDKKVIIFKKKRRTTYRRKNGHRQQVTVIRIKAIN